MKDWKLDRNLRNKFHEAFEASKKAGNSNTVYTFEMLQALHDMAENGVYPDGAFGDMDCNVWAMFSPKES